MKIKQEVHKFKKGEVYLLDSIYRLRGIIPYDSYGQDDILDRWGEDNTRESIKFVKDVTLKISIITD